MKVWWVLTWDTYYPSGGLGNVRATFETEAEAKDCVDLIRKTDEAQGYDSWGENIEIVDVSRRLGIMEKNWNGSSYEDE